MVSFFVLLLLGASTLNTPASLSTLQAIGWECLCAVFIMMAIQAVSGTWLAFLGRYRWSSALLVGSCAAEGLMLFLVSRTHVLTSTQATEVIAGLHVLCTLMFGAFGSVWHRSVNKASPGSLFLHRSNTGLSLLCLYAAGETGHDEQKSGSSADPENF